MNLGLLALLLPAASGTIPVGPPPRPLPSEFTFVKVLGPLGSRLHWYPGTPSAFETANGASVALRPGYSYRFQLSNIGPRANGTIWPSIEVRGSLIPRPNLDVALHPIPVILSEDDIENVLSGRFLTKIYYLEDPSQAANGPQPLGVPLEASAASEEEAFKEARARGRLMIIVRVGERLWTPEELACANAPGSIWAPALMKNIPTPLVPPHFPYVGVAAFDLGPKALIGECLYDGGDQNLNMGIGFGNKLYGLDPSDTAFEFTTPSGKKVVTSNRVCICVPRFAVERVEVAALTQHGVRGPQIGLQREGQRQLVHKLPQIAVKNVAQPIGATGETRASGLFIETGPVVKATLIGKPEAVAVVSGVKVSAQLRETEELTVYPDCSLVLVKRVDPPNPSQIGEIVTFYLSYRNPGAVKMTNLVVSDSLTGRLEFIEGSAKSDRAATFTAAPNEAGSMVLRWAIDGDLLPGHRGVVSFRARIR